MNAQLDLDYIRARRDDGIERAVTHADDVQANWSAAAAELLEAWAPGRGPFLAETFVKFATPIVGAPPDGRAWGAVFRRARIAGFLVQEGCARATTSNLSWKPLWRAA